MCGIAGVLQLGGSAQTAEHSVGMNRALEMMRTRGPDGVGVWGREDGPCLLGHRRLAIIDLSTDAAQPMVSACARYTVVFNGEIYNYKALRAELENEGVEFRSNSDTEVLLYLYRRDGALMCPRLRGMFAFAIWDKQANTLFLARDTFGIKPLYFQQDSSTFRFASQVKAIAALGAPTTSLSAEAVAWFWMNGHVPEPFSLYEGIDSLPAGHWMTVDAYGKRSSAEFCSVLQLLSGSAPSSMDVPNYPSLREAVLDSVRHHLVADVPVGLFLSAGIDSATLLALASECSGRLQTVTLGFEEFRGTPDDETVLAAQVARHYGAAHSTVWTSRQEFEQSVEQFFESMDQPSFDGLNTWLVSRAAAGCGLRVALSGLGGDEFFGGYPSFQQVPKLVRYAAPMAAIPGVGRLLRRLVSKVAIGLNRPKLAGLIEYGGSLERAYLLRRALRMPWEVLHERLQDERVFRSGYGRLKWLHDANATDARKQLGDDFAQISWLESTRYMRSQLLRDSDWASMAHSLEVRVPLVDTGLTAYLAQSRISKKTQKKRDLALSPQLPLPTEIVTRPKSGFGVPVRDWLSQSANPQLEALGLRGYQRLVATRWGL